MNKVTNYFTYLPKRASIIAIALVSVFAISTVAFASFGPSRPTKEYLGPGTSGFDYVTFNSFTNTSYGDERDFLRAKHDGADNSTLGDSTTVTDGDVVKVYMRVHNNADTSLNATGAGVAEDLTVKVNLPTGASTSQDITGYINASNAVPTEIFDTTTIKS